MSCQHIHGHFSVSCHQHFSSKCPSQEKWTLGLEQFCCPSVHHFKNPCHSWFDKYYWWLGLLTFELKPVCFLLILILHVPFRKKEIFSHNSLCNRTFAQDWEFKSLSAAASRSEQPSPLRRTASASVTWSRHKVKIYKWGFITLIYY